MIDVTVLGVVFVAVGLLTGGARRTANHRTSLATSASLPVSLTGWAFVVFVALATVLATERVVASVPARPGCRALGV
jgi:hypothetical protein